MLPTLTVLLGATEGVGVTRINSSNSGASPLSGTIIGLKDGSDAAFASGALGQGVIIEPGEGVVVAPFNGKVTALFAEVGFKVYRFSISWSRLFPTGNEVEPNPEGLAFYRELLEELKSHAIEPLVTISNFEIPLGLVKPIGGWRSADMIDRYLHLATTVMTEVKDYVTYWLTFNEINMILHPPFPAAGLIIEQGEDAKQVMFQAANYQMVASALAVQAGRQINPDKRMGLMFASVRNPYLKASEWGWPIDPLGLRITTPWGCASR